MDNGGIWWCGGVASARPVDGAVENFARSEQRAPSLHPVFVFLITEAVRATQRHHSQYCTTLNHCGQSSTLSIRPISPYHLTPESHSTPIQSPL